VQIPLPKDLAARTSTCSMAICSTYPTREYLPIGMIVGRIVHLPALFRPRS
jgi:hypothetical protein